MAPKKKKTRKRSLDADMSEKGFASVKIAADLLRMDVTAVHRLCKEERLEHVRVGGDAEGRMARVFVKRTSLRAYLGPETAKLLGV